MPLYLVRGPATWGALIRAHDLDHLFRLIDEIADPGTCSVSEYTGPVAIELELPATVGLRESLGEAVEDVVVEFECDPRSVDLYDLPKMTIFGDVGTEMRRNLCKKLFPAIDRLAESWGNTREYGNTHVEDDAHVSEFREAIAADVRDQLKAAQWRTAGVERSVEHNSDLQRSLRVTVDPEMLVRGGDAHRQWSANDWNPPEEDDSRVLVGRLCSCLDRGEITKARELANQLRDVLCAPD